MQDYANADFYTDIGHVADPQAYFAYLNSRGPITPLPRPNALAVTGYDEAIEIMLDSEHFSSANATVGAAVKLPFTPEGDDIRAQVEDARGQKAFDDLIVTTEDSGMSICARCYPACLPLAGSRRWKRIWLAPPTR